MKRYLWTALAILPLGLCFLTTSTPKTDAMPMFARKYGVTCNVCHTTIPRLNETGYKFRAAGFRLPEEIGKSDEKKIELGDYFSARVQARYDTQKTNGPNGAPNPNVIGGVAGQRTSTNSFNFQEATLYPLTGSWGKYFGSLAELSVSPEDVFEIENAYVRFVAGKPNKFFTSRVGIFHPWEGFGASDRPFSNARPLFQTNPISAGGRGVPYVFQSWGLDEAGVEIGGDINKLSVRAAVLNGTLMRWEEEANAFLPFPAQTGPWKGANQAIAALGKPFNAIAHNTPDFSANATYILHPDGGGISLLYYHGNAATPTRCSDGTPIGATNAAGDVCGVTAPSTAAPYGTAGMTDFDYTAAGGAFRNNFDRVAAYLAYPLAKRRFHPQAGFQWGRDTNPNGTKFNSRGAFVEGSYQFGEKLTAGLRYDFWKPKYAANAFGQWAVTPYVSIPLQNGFQVIAEYQHRDFQINAANHRQNDTLQARIIFIK
jgi:hypothetical protein